MSALIAAIAALVGILLGYVLRNATAASEKAHLAQRIDELGKDLTATRADLAGVQAQSNARAGFESLSAERERANRQLNDELARSRAELALRAESEQTQAARISQLETELRNERQNLGEKLALLDAARETLAHQFQALAADILEKKSKSFTETSQKDLNTLLSPLQSQLREFREKVEQAQSDSKTGVTKLETLIGALGTLNQQLSDEARNLTTALRGSAKSQGDWGEFILRDLLEKAGLREGEQYSFQQSFADVENGDRTRSVRTDVILYLPGGRNLVVDSKVSLRDYSDCVNASTEEERKASLKRHVASVRGHIAGLAKSGYHRLPDLEAPDFVVMFVPIEPAFLMALQADGDLWSDAYRQGILLVGPTTLLYVIRIVNVLWQQENQARNVREVMDRGSELYEKFVGFVTDMEVLGDSLRKSRQYYDGAMNKLAEGRGNLIRQVEMLKKLGLRTTKSLPKALLDRANVDQEELALLPNVEESNKTT